MKREIKLTESEWQEVYYALETKRWGIERGEYGPKDEDVDTERWAYDLAKIAAKIAKAVNV